MLDYENDQDAHHQLNPRSMIEIIGIAKWDGQGGSPVYPFGFLVVTHTGSIYYLAANSDKEREEWMLHIRYGLECNFANPEVIEFKPSKVIYDPPALERTLKCAKSGTPIGMGAFADCKCCGRTFLPEHVVDTVPVLQLGVEEVEKVCSDCKNAQLVMVWLKSLNYVHVSELHERTPTVLSAVSRFKSSFRFRRHCSQRLDMAAQLLEQNQITPEEFEELRKVDHDFRHGTAVDEAEKLKIALDALGNDVQTIIGLLSNPAATYSSRSMGGDTLRNSNMLFLQVLLRLLEIGEKEPDLLDFFWPQLMQIHLLISATRKQGALMKVNLIQSALLAIAMRHEFLAMKLAWCLLASISDYAEKKISQNQYAACLCLLLQLEIVTSGTCACLTRHVFRTSEVAAIPNTKLDHNAASKSPIEALPHRVMSQILCPSQNQQREITFELYTLFKARAVLMRSHRERRFEQVIRELDDKRRGWSSRLALAGEGLTGLEQDAAQVSIGDSPSSGDVPALDVIGGASDTKTPAVADPPGFPEASILDLMLHLGCMDYSKITFPLPMAGGGMVKGHLFASIAADLYDKSVGQRHIAAHSTGAPGTNAPETPAATSVAAPAHGDASVVVDGNRVSAEQEAEEEPLCPATFDDYDYFAEWVNHRAEEISLEIDFIDAITELVDSLRFVDRALRTSKLRVAIGKLFAEYEGSGWYGYDPTCSADEPRYRIRKVITDECRVFRTKARAPSMIVCIVQRDDSRDELRGEQESIVERDAIDAVRICNYCNDRP